MLEVIARSEHTQFWLYTRSWRVPTIFPVLKAISVLPNCKVWFSADAEASPAEVPDNVRVAWMHASRHGMQPLVYYLPPLSIGRVGLRFREA